MSSILLETVDRVSRPARNNEAFCMQRMKKTSKGGGTLSRAYLSLPEEMNDQHAYSSLCEMVSEQQRKCLQ